MSPSGSSDHVILLRSAIERIEMREAKPAPAGARSHVPLGEGLAINSALGGGLKLAAVHEMVPASPGDHAATCGFALALAAVLARGLSRPRAALLWIVEDFAVREAGAPYGPGLSHLGIDLASLVLVHTARPQDALYALEEALKSRAGVVIGELWGKGRALDLTASRRLALAARTSGTPGLIIHAGLPGQAGDIASASSTRLEIASHASAHEAAANGPVPIPGPAAWSVRVIKARAGPKSIGALDRERRHFLTFDPEKGCFCNALSLPAPALPANRPRFAGDAGEPFAKTG